jgi:hypothetical protein
MMRSVGTNTHSSDTSSTLPRRRDVVVVVVFVRFATRFGAFSGGSGRQPTNFLLRRHSTQAGAHWVSATHTQP